jgi:hypothetical protein
MVSNSPLVTVRYSSSVYVSQKSVVSYASIQVAITDEGHTLGYWNTSTGVSIGLYAYIYILCRLLPLYVGDGWFDYHGMLTEWTKLETE